MSQMRWVESDYEPTREEYEAAITEREAAQRRGCGGCKTIIERHDCGCIMGVSTPWQDAVVQAFEGKRV